MGGAKSGPIGVWIVSELYYPEETSTGYILTRIAEGLAADFRVRVACGQPSYSARGLQAPWRESRHGVEIHRCWATTWNKDALAKRLVNLISISCSVFLKLLLHLRRMERVLVVTNPPLLPFLVAFACRLRGAKCLLLIHDVYPEVAVAAGILRANSLPARMLNWSVRRLYRSVAQIIVLGRDMQELVRQKCADDKQRAVVITNWADLDLVDGLLRAGYFDSAVGKEMNLATGKEIRILDMANRVNELTGNKAGIMKAPHRKWDTKVRLLASIDRARELIGYEPKVEFDAGLKQTVQWFKDNWDDVRRDAEFRPGMSAATRGVQVKKS